MSAAREVKFSGILEGLIESRGFSRARKKICAAIRVSPSALTQYVTAKARPSLDTLLALAAFFDVSLDYLVYGAPEAVRAEMDYGPVVRYVDLALADVQKKSDRHAALYTRVARVLSERIGTVAREIAESGSASSGMLADDETMLLESYSLETCVAIFRLDDDVQQPPVRSGEPSPSSSAAMGRFLPTVARNLQVGRKYRYLLAPDVGNWRPMVNGYLTMLGQHGAPTEGCRFRTSRAPLLAGSGMYRLSVSQLGSEHPVLFERIRPNVSDDGWVGYLAPPSDEVHADALMDLFHLEHARRAFERLWRGADAM